MTPPSQPAWLVSAAQQLALAENSMLPLAQRVQSLAGSADAVDAVLESCAAGEKRPWPDDRAAFGMIDAVQARQQDVFASELLPLLRIVGVRLLAADDMTPSQAKWLHHYFRTNLLPLLTPLAMDASHPFPPPRSKSLWVAVALRGNDAFGRPSHLGVVQVPISAPKMIELPQGPGGERDFVLLSTALQLHVGELFSGREVPVAVTCRVVCGRDGVPVRVQVAQHCPAEFKYFLLGLLGLPSHALVRVSGPLHLGGLAVLANAAAAAPGTDSGQWQVAAEGD